MKKAVIVTNDGIDGPADWMAAEGEGMALQMVGGNHAGYNAMLRLNPHADPMALLESMLNQAYANWRNVGEFCK